MQTMFTHKYSSHFNQRLGFGGLKKWRSRLSGQNFAFQLLSLKRHWKVKDSECIFNSFGQTKPFWQNSEFCIWWLYSKQGIQTNKALVDPSFCIFPSLKKTFTDSSHFFDGSKIPMKFLNGLRHLLHSHKGIIFSFELCSSFVNSLNYFDALFTDR